MVYRVLSTRGARTSLFALPLAGLLLTSLVGCAGNDVSFRFDGSAQDTGRADGLAMGEGGPGADAGPMRFDVVPLGDSARPGDAGPDARPTAMEICFNGLDDNADGRVDEMCACQPGETQRCFNGPAARAGIGACGFGMQTCVGSTEFGDWSACTGATLPAGELCDGVDNDCDGTVDNGCNCRAGDMRACYSGAPGTRTIGACADGTQRCVEGPGGVGADWGPCTGETLPGRESCDGADNDCNGTVDDGCACTPGTTRACYGGPAGTANVGLCRAGTQACAASGGGSSWGACLLQVLPAPELCDGMDNDCDGTVDNGCLCTVGDTRSCYTGPAGTVGVGLCRAGMETCVANAGGVGTSWGPCAGATLPSSELCDGADNNCNGAVDDGCACRMGETRACYTGPSGTSGVGICAPGTQGCVITGGVASWGACTGQTLPGTESCNMLDDNCNGTVDDGCACTPGATRACYGGAAGTDGVGVCHAGMQTCVAGTGGSGSAWGTCTGQVLPGRESCNMIDDDCNGRVDDGVSCTGPTAMCPAPITAPAGTTVNLSATTTGAVSYRWEVIMSPPGTTYTLGSPTTATTTFTSVFVGTYTIQLTVTDAMGRTATCTVTITMQGHGLRVEMFWDTAATDIDLHLHNNTAAAWFGAPMNSDCFFSEPRPRWDVNGSTADDPSLDTDDRDGLGPENIRIDSPVVSAETYTVGVHYWSGTPRTNATVRIYCGTVLVATYNHALNGGAALGASNDFWRVARVQFTSASACTVTPVNDVIPFSTARTGSP